MAQPESLVCTWLPPFCPFLIFTHSNPLDVWNYVSFQCPADPHEDRERGHSRIGPRSPPLFWFTPSPTFSFSPLLSLSLSLASLAPAVHQPPAVLPAVSALRTNSLTTMQVRGREKEHTALTIDQWRPLKQSLPFSPSLLSPCQGWKRQTFGTVDEAGSTSGKTGARSHLSATSNNKHTFTHWFSGLSPHHPSVCSFGEALHCPIWAQS